MSVAEALDPEYTLGERIRRARKDRGWKQEDLAKAVGVSRPQVSKWERNGAVPDVFEAVRIASSTNTSLGWLAGVPLTGRYLQYVQVSRDFDVVRHDVEGQLSIDDAPRYDGPAKPVLCTVG